MLLHVRFVLLVGFFFFQAEDGIRDDLVTGVQTCALPIFESRSADELPGAASRSPPDQFSRPASALLHVPQHDAAAEEHAREIAAIGDRLDILAEGDQRHALVEALLEALGDGPARLVAVGIDEGAADAVELVVAGPAPPGLSASGPGAPRAAHHVCNAGCCDR